MRAPSAPPPFSILNSQFSILQQDDRRSPSSSRRVGVVEILDPVECPQEALNALALDSDAAAVDQADLPQASSACLLQILARDVLDVGRTERMEIDHVLDRHFDRLVLHARILCDTPSSKSDTESSMVLFNHATREMTAKIVYYGPGLCGKTTNLMVIFDKLDPKSKGKMLSLATKTDRTLFFDLLPVDIGKVGNFNLKIQLYTVPGQVFYNETRKLVLKGADAVVFVADSQPAMVEANKESFANLLENMTENQIDPDDTPIVIQFNKRDIPGVLPVEDLQEALDLEGYPFAEASALKGEGVMETFKLVSKITAKHLFNRLKGKSEPIDRKKPEKGSKAKAAKAAPREPDPLPETPFPDADAPSSPFADSVPFPEATADPLDAGYEKAEEVSLEQLLQGRERPATMSGNVAIPVDVEEIEEIEPEAMVAVMDEPAQSGASGSGAQAEVRQLQQKIKTMQQEHRAQLEALLESLDELTSRVRRHLE